MLHFKFHQTLIRTKPPPFPLGASLSSSAIYCTQWQTTSASWVCIHDQCETISATSSSQSTTTIDPPSDANNIKGIVVLMKKNLLELNDLGASFKDRVHELSRKAVSLRLVSADN